MEFDRDHSAPDRSAEYILKTTGIAYVVYVVGWYLLAPEMELLWRLWVPFLLANLTVWGTMLTALLVRSVVEVYRTVAPMLSKLRVASQRTVAEPVAATSLSDRLAAYLTRFLEAAR